MTNDQIRTVFLASGFTVKEGQTDLKPYVYKAARALLALANTERNPWHEAVLEECCKIEAAYRSDDPRATLQALVNWYVLNERNPVAAQESDAAVIERAIREAAEKFGEDRFARAIAEIRSTGDQAC